MYLIKKIIKEIQKLEQQKQIKLNKRSQLDDELMSINARLKELNNLKNQYEKLEQNADSLFMNTKGEGESHGKI
ncbi:hypothetical protein [Longibaculum muris]|uniref:hypothetical protein n=1 Tax=Longibaculum muris TaxID=1796628 RepID=UPI00294228D1|nr:hypothetical protein [Longibaculum muris]